MQQYIAGECLKKNRKNKGPLARNVYILLVLLAIMFDKVMSSFLIQSLFGSPVKYLRVMI